MASNEIEEIYQLINQVDAKIPSQQENAIVIIGDTGEGKSALLNYLAEVPLFSKADEGFDEFVINTDSAVEGMEIGDGCVAKTSLPSSWMEFWDCPGFGDTRGSVQDIVNAFSIYKLIKSAKKVKVLVIVSENTIKGSRRKSFLNLIRNVGETFKNTDELIYGLCLVVTKNESLNLEKMRKGLHKILKEQDDQENFNISQRKILDFLSSPKSQIVFFNAPQKEGLISDEDRSLILEGLNKISYLENPEPSISISPESKNLISSLSEKLNDDIENFISLKFCPEILVYIGKLIEYHSDTIDELRSLLKQLSDQLENISDEPSQFENNLYQIFLTTKMLQNEELKDKFYKKIFQLDFIKLIKPESLKIRSNTSSWYRFILESLRNLNILISLPEKDIQGRKLTLKGLMIGIKDLNTAMKDQNLSEINIYSLKYLFIDEDVIAPGINLTLISPRMSVIGKRIINLKGNPGPQHQPSKASDGVSGSEDQINGKDGLPGLPGGNGGNFYAKGKKFFNMSSLTIDVSGGDGGKGQDGGNGAKGMDGRDHGRENVMNRKESALILRENFTAESRLNYIEKGIKFFLTFNDKFREIYESYDPGQKGGNGGQGGVGGLGGKSGSVIIECQFQSSENPTIIKSCGRGEDGRGGRPGLGGKNGPKYRGIYINEAVFPQFRGINPTDPNKPNEIAKGTGIAAVTVTSGAITKEATKELVFQQSGQITITEGSKQLISKGGLFVKDAVITTEGTKQLISKGGWFVKDAVVATEGSKIFMQEVTKNSFKVLSQEAAEEVTKQGGKVIIKDVLKVGATESGKHVVKVGGNAFFSIMQGVGISLAAQAVISPISAHLSSYWEKEVHEIIYDDIKCVSNGESPFSLNVRDIKQPFEQTFINKEKQNALYDQFYRQKGEIIDFTTNWCLLD
ncbi:hypothetical protein RclHR1_00830012 [Rhizophagus clarus]|uniref:GTPase domain-containing protein n=1 Tax=Rhizophagus clarus TaxID=94130 RepID=A0A2Z6S2B0_9GLOM|nr:hypothetical protein RclHR1_00830012 [Rhizophagus clarus]GES99694.1 GTPase domain-containing protein [Rhizophagus clarus]